MAPLRTPRARLRIALPRPLESVAIDRAETTGRRDPAENLEIPPFIPWGRFLSEVQFRQGEHITIVGSTGSGKTTLALRLLPFRKFTCVLATKNVDESLYPRLEDEGYEITDDPDLDWEKQPKVIFRPKLSLTEGAEKAQIVQREKFQDVLVKIFDEGGWQVYGDEVRYLSDNLKLKRELELLWLQGRSLGITITVSTQRPVSIPVVAFESASHLFLFKTTDQANIDRAAEFESANKPLLRYLLPRLPFHEVLYIEARTGRMLRTKVHV